MKTILLSLFAASLFGAVADNGVTIHVPQSLTAQITIVDDQGVTTIRTISAPPAVLAASAHFVADTTDPTSGAKYADAADLILQGTASTSATLVARYASDAAVAAAIATAASQPAVAAAISAAAASAPPPVPAVVAAATPVVTVSH